MSEKTLNVKLLLRNGLSAEWETSTKILGKGELAWASDTGEFKIGDGEHTWKEITRIYKDFESVQSAINTAVAGLSKTNVSEINVGRGVNHQEHLPTGAAKGDIAIVREVISGDKKQYTAYVYTGSAWAAMDGNYDAENVYFAEDLTFTSNIGVLTVPESGSGTINAAGKNVKEVLSSILAKAQDPKVTPPSASITLKEAGAKEAGTKVTPTYTAKLNAGSYTYGPATGIVASSYSVTDGVEGHDAQTGATGTFPEIQVVDGMNYKLSATIAHEQGTIPKNNLGTEKPALRIPAGTKSANSGAITAYRNSFYGSVNDKTAALDSAAIRGLKGKSGKTNSAGNTFNAREEVGAMRVIIAVPSPRTCTSIKDVNGLNAEAISAFTKTTVQVEGANGYEAKEYNVYYKDNADACNKANDWAVTLG